MRVNSAAPSRLVGISFLNANAHFNASCTAITVIVPCRGSHFSQFRCAAFQLPSLSSHFNVKPGIEDSLQNDHNFSEEEQRLE